MLVAAVGKVAGNDHHVRLLHEVQKMPCRGFQALRGIHHTEGQPAVATKMKIGNLKYAHKYSLREGESLPLLGQMCSTSSPRRRTAASCLRCTMKAEMPLVAAASMVYRQT